MTRDAEVPAGDYLALVLKGLGTETDQGVVERLLQQCRHAVLQLGAADLAAGRLATLSAGCLDLALAAETGSDLQRTFVSAFVESTPHTELLAGLLAGSDLVPGLAVDTGMRWSVVRRLAALGAAPDALIAAELARDDTAEGRLHQLAALAARPDAEAKAQAWSQIVDSDGLSHHETMAVISGFNVPEQRDVLTPYASLFYEQLLPVWAARATRSATTGLQVRALLPAWDVSSAGLRAMETALSGELPGPLRRVLEDARDELVRSLRCRSLEAPVMV